MKKYYDILGVPLSANQTQIKRAYYKLAKQFHPDICKEPNAKEMFIKINEAYEILTSDEARASVKRNKQETYSPSSYTRTRASEKAYRKAKMSAEQFRKYRFNKIQKDKKLFINMLLSLIIMDVAIVSLIAFSQDKNSITYNPDLPIGAGIAVSIPIVVISVIIMSKYFSLNEDAKIFWNMNNSPNE